MQTINKAITRVSQHALSSTNAHKKCFNPVSKRSAERELSNIFHRRSITGIYAELCPENHPHLGFTLSEFQFKNFIQIILTYSKNIVSQLCIS